MPGIKVEQRAMTADILKRESNAIVLDDKAMRELKLSWIDRIEEFDALMND